MDCDGVVGLSDCILFEVAISDPDSYVDRGFLSGDLNEDGLVDCVDAPLMADAAGCPLNCRCFGDLNSSGGKSNVDDLLCMLDVIGGVHGATCNAANIVAARLVCDIGGTGDCGPSGDLPNIDDLLGLLDAIGGPAPCPGTCF